MNRILFVALLMSMLTAPILSAQSSCGGNGLLLQTIGGRLGDDFAVGVVGTPLTSGFMGFSFSSNTTGPAGICLPLPSTNLLPIGLDGSGLFILSGTLAPLSAVDGVNLFLQAALADVNAPGGLAVSNLSGISLKAPRIFLIDKGQTFVTPPIPASVTAVNALDGTVSWTTTFPLFIRDVVRVKSAGVVAIVFSDDSLRFVDEATGAVVGSTVLPISASDLEAAPDGAPRVLALDPGTPANAGSPAVAGRIVEIDVATALPAASIISLPGPVMAPMVGVPNTQVVYLFSSGNLLPVDYAVQLALPVTPLPAYASAITSSYFTPGEVMLLLRGAPAQFFTPDGPGGLFAVNTGTHLGIAGRNVQFATGGFPRKLVKLGASFYVNVGAGPDRILEINEASLATTNSLPLGTSTSSAIATSTLGTKLLVMGSGVAPATPGFLGELDLSTFTIAVSVPTPPEFQSVMEPLASDSAALAFVATGNSTLITYSTDPLVGPGVPQVMPAGAGITSILQDR